MQHFQKVGEFEATTVSKLMAQLNANPQLWDERTSRKDKKGSPHTGMQDIWVRYSADGTNDPHIPVWYPAWKALPSLHHYIYDLMNLVRGEMLGGILITKIPSGGGIDRHVDEGWHVDYYEKFYLCLQNDPGAVFYCEHEGVTEGLEPK